MKCVHSVFLLFAFLVVSVAFAHEGRRDSYGCHPNVAHGTYHCHSGPLAKRQFKNKEQMIKVLREEDQKVRPKSP